MDKGLRETTNLRVEITNRKRQKWETWSRGTNSRFPFDVNVMLNLSITISLVRASLSWNLNALCSVSK